MRHCKCLDVCQIAPAEWRCKCRLFVSKDFAEKKKGGYL
jgi:hypothetical protein